MPFEKMNKAPETPEIAKCDKHGEFEVRYQQWVPGKFFVSRSCPQCAEEEKKREDEKLAQERKEHWDRVLLGKKEAAGVSRRNSNVKFKNFVCDNEQMKVAKDSVYYFAKSVFDGNDTPSMILAGGVGTGKTMLACATINAIIEKRSCKMIKMIDLFRKLKDTWRKDSEHSELELIKAYSNIDLLIIDEVGVNYDSDTEKMFIFDIIDGRYQNMKPTMLISNLSVDVIKEVIGERAFDRLRDGGGEAVAFDWESKRT